MNRKILLLICAICTNFYAQASIEDNSYSPEELSNMLIKDVCHNNIDEDIKNKIVPWLTKNEEGINCILRLNKHFAQIKNNLNYIHKLIDTIEYIQRNDSNPYSKAVTNTKMYLAKLVCDIENIKPDSPDYNIASIRTELKKLIDNTEYVQRYHTTSNKKRAKYYEKLIYELKSIELNCSKQCDINNIKNQLKELVKDIKENKLNYPNSKYVTTDNLSQYIEKCTILDTEMHDMVFDASIGCNSNWQEDVLREVIKIGFVLRKIRNKNNTNNMNAQLLQLHNIITFTDNDVYNFVTKDFNINEIVKNYSSEYIIRNVNMLDIVLHKRLREKAQKQKTKHEYWNAYDAKNYLIDVCLPELKRFCDKVQTHGLYNISINKCNDQDNNKYNRKVSHVANNYNISIYKQDVKKIPYTENTVYNNIINVVTPEHYPLPIIALHELLHVEYQINEAKGIYYVNDFRIICRKICDKLMSNAIMHNLNKFNYESMYSDILNALMLFDNAEELATITGLRVDNNGKLLVLPCENMALLRESGSIRLSHISAIIPGSRLFYEFLVTDCYNCKNLIYKHAANSKKLNFLKLYIIYTIIYFHSSIIAVKRNL